MSEGKFSEDKLFKVIVGLAILGILLYGYLNMDALRDLVRHLLGFT
jgi:hypothetical protein